MKNKLKKQDGITLIALIITIITLLILAGITINLTLGQNGILTQAQNAGIENQKAQVKEKIELAILDIKTDKLAKRKQMVREDLKELESIGATIETTGIPTQGQYKEYYFEIDEEYKVTIIGKVQGEKPAIQAEILTQGIVAEGGTVEIKVTASIGEGNITALEATNGAVLKEETSITEKTFTVSANGTYTFKVTADNGRSNTASVEINTIIEKPSIEIKDITKTGFTITVTNNYKEELITEYKYYVGGILKSEVNTTTKEFTVTGLTVETKYENIYVEVYIEEQKLTSEATTAETIGEVLEVVWTNNTSGNRTIDGKEGTYNNPTIPVGFSAVNTESAKWNIKDGALSDWDKGLVIKNATDGNEFVWIPCTIDGANGTIKYDRYSFGSFLNSGYSDESYSEEMPSDEKTSVETYKGFYIGRYESGIIGYDERVATSNSSNSTTWTGYSNGTLVIQRNKQVWNYITRDRAKTESEGLYNKTKGDTANSRLCSSYAWDTALKFIETKYPEYPTNSTQGNYNEKSVTLGRPAKTGKTEAVNNIYDMGGNVREWTTEDSSNARFPYVQRGGYCTDSSSTHPAAFRIDYGTDYANGYIGFRSTLYM